MKKEVFIQLLNLADTESRSAQERIIESLRLEKTSKIIKPSHQPSTTMITKTYPRVNFLMPNNKVSCLTIFLETKFVKASGLWRGEMEELCYQEECSSVFKEVPGKLWEDNR